jgi:citrate synthase
MWLSATEALRRLNVKPQTLYASVSRGRIRAKADPADPRRSLYSRDDVDRLARRATGRPSAELVAAEAISWGDPVLSSSISTIMGGRLWYRGQDAVALADKSTLEDVAGLLWGGFPRVELTSSADLHESGMNAAIVALAARLSLAPASLGRSPALLRDDAADLVALLAHALAGSEGGLLHHRLAARYGRPHASDDLRCALVLLADHELNASTFAARVAVSTGASLAAGTLAALATLSGPLHGRASIAVAALVDDIGAAEASVSAALRDWLGEGRLVPGFGHRLYPKGDIRAAALLERLTVPPAYADFRAAAEDLVGEGPNVDFALAALAAVHKLPATAPIEIFALARSVGWLAHMLEQAETGSIIRPRARYIGPKPPVP